MQVVLLLIDTQMKVFPYWINDIKMTVIFLSSFVLFFNDEL